MAKRKNKKRQNKKRQKKVQQRKALLPRLSDTVNLAGACVASCHPVFAVPVALIVWAVAWWDRNR